MASRVEYLNFDAVASLPSLALNLAGCWECADYAQMYDAPPVVGEDRPIPGVLGRLAVAHEEDEAEIHLPIEFLGEANYSGTPWSDERIGVRSNLRDFRSKIVRPVAGNTTRPVTFHRLDTGTEAGAVIVIPPLQVVFLSPVRARGVLTFVVPAAVLA